MENSNNYFKMKTFKLLFFTILIIFTTLNSCNQKKEELIKIGAILPLTGNLSYLGEEERNVLLLLEDSISKINNFKIKFLIEDSKSNAKDGISAYKKLNMQGVKYYITSLTIVAKSIGPLIDKNDQIQFVLSIDPYITKEYNNTFRIYYDIAQEMKLTAQYLSNKNAKNVASLYINTPESEIAINDILKKRLAKKGIKMIQKETYDFNSSSVKNQLLKLKSKNPDYITTIDFGYMYPIILKEAEEIQMRRKILGGLGMMTAPKIDSKLLAGITFFCSTFVINPNDDYIKFDNMYRKKFGKRTTFDGVYLFDATNILIDLIKGGESNKIINKSYNGISGKIKIDSTKSSIIDIAIAKYLEDGKMELIYTKDY